MPDAAASRRHRLMLMYVHLAFAKLIASDDTLCRYSLHSPTEKCIPMIFYARDNRHISLRTCGLFTKRKHCLAERPPQREQARKYNRSNCATSD